MKPLPGIERHQSGPPPPLSSLPWTIPDTETSPEFMNFNIDYDNKYRQDQTSSNLKSSATTTPDLEKEELCINATGIIVAIVTFSGKTRIKILAESIDVL